MSANEGNVFYLGDFDDSMEREVLVPLAKEIQRQARYKDGKIDLWINSYGGYRHLVFNIISLVELAKRSGVIVRTIVPDIAYSAGSILAVTGSPGERYIERTAEHLMHYGTTGSADETPEQVDRNYRQKKAAFSKIYKHYEKYSNVPDLEQMMNDDAFYVPAVKCIKWGLADKYMDKFDIGQDLD